MTDEIFYKEMDHTADLRVEIYGRDLADLFRNAVKTIYRVLNIDPSSELPCREEGVVDIFNVYGLDKEDALIKLMGELLYLAMEEHKQLIVDTVQVNASSPEGYGFMATLEGRWHSLEKEAFGEIKEIKAVTYHDANIEQQAQGFTATVVMDT